MADKIAASIVVQGMLPDVFNIWTHFDNFPIFMENIKSVEMTGERTSHWVMEGPLGTEFEWDAETTELEENRRVAWRSLAGSEMQTSGQVTFRELGPNETEVNVVMQYDPPGGEAGEVLASLFSNPEARLKADLRRFKEYVESTADRIHESRED